MTGSAHGTNGRSEQRAERGRFSSRRKSEAVLRLLHGEELDALSRELVVTGATLSQWRERFLAAGQAALQEPAQALDALLEAQQLRSSCDQTGPVIFDLVHERCTPDRLLPRQRRRMVPQVVNQLQRAESIEPLMKTTKSGERGRRLLADL